MSVEKRISLKKFMGAVEVILEELMEDNNLPGEIRLVVPLIVPTVASKMITILFEDNKGDK